MSRTRADRRRVYAMRKRRVREYLARYSRWIDDINGEQNTPTARNVGFAANTPHGCSCGMCRNQRHAWGKKTRSVQERRAQYR